MARMVKLYAICYQPYAKYRALSSLETEFFSNVLLGPFTLSQSKGARSDRGESTVTIH